MMIIYSGAAAVARASFRIRRGELVALLGPNGSGKTTLLRMLSGALSPTEGRARLCGMDVAGHPLDIRRRCGYLPEETPLYSEMRVEEYLRYRGRLRGYRGTDLLVRVHGAMQQCGLVDVAKRPLIGALSHGQRRRVALADCLLHSPDVLLLDGPLEGLDAVQTASLAGLLIDISADCAVLFTTHDPEGVKSVCTRALVLSAGCLIADGTPEGLTAAVPGAGTFAQAFVRMASETAEAGSWSGGGGGKKGRP